MQFDPEKIYWQAHRGGGGKRETSGNTLNAMVSGSPAYRYVARTVSLPRSPRAFRARICEG